MTKLYKLAGSDLTPIPQGTLANEAMIEGWVAKEPSLLGLDVLIIGRQVQRDVGGRIDLLGLDVQGNLVLIELKRDRTSREIVAQVLDYASWVATLKTPQVHEIATTYLGGSLDAAF